MLAMTGIVGTVSTTPLSDLYGRAMKRRTHEGTTAGLFGMPRTSQRGCSTASPIRARPDEAIGTRATALLGVFDAR